MITSRRKSHVALRVSGLLLLIMILLTVGILWFDILGIIRLREFILPLLKTFDFTSTEQSIPVDDPLLLDRKRLLKAQEAINLLQEELDLRDQELEKKNNEILQKQNSLAEKERTLEDQMNSFNAIQKQAEDKQRNLNQVATYLTTMPPDKAVMILNQKDDQEIVDLFRTVERQAKALGQDSMVSTWLSRMSAERAATISRKMAIKPNN